VGVAVGSKGHIYVAEFGNDRIKVFGLFVSLVRFRFRVSLKTIESRTWGKRLVLVLGLDLVWA
jgi:hypothetical protein